MVVFALLCMLPIQIMGQPEVFSLADFELRGPVKSCTVVTAYGEERFEFDRDGRLTKSLTRFSDAEYDITYYRYRGPVLAERRDERVGTRSQQQLVEFQALAAGQFEEPLVELQGNSVHAKQ